MKSLSYPRLLSLVCLIGTLSFIGGCSADMNMPDSQGTSDFGTVHGAVYGGQQPLTGAHVYVFETPSGAGYGTKSPKSLIGVAGSSVTCNSSISTGTGTLPIVRVGTGTAAQCYYQTGGYNGALAQNTAVGAGEFNLAGLYKCDVGQDVWLYSISGYPDTNSAQDLNPYASLMAALGPCPGTPGGTGDFSSDSFIYMNELSTVAMAYSTAGFAADPTTVGTNSGVLTMISAPSTNLVGITNAFNTAQQLYNIFGTTDSADLSAPSTTTSGNGTSPNQLINTLGNILAACINSPNNKQAANISNNCKSLFSSIYNNQTTQTDTASAIIHLAKNPIPVDPTDLLSLAVTNPVWQPYYTSALPAELTAAITYAGVGSPQGIVLDPGGNAFVTDYTSNGFIAKISPIGAVTTTAALSPVINNAATLAVDTTGLIWSPSVATGELYQVANSTTFTSVTDAAPSGTFTPGPPATADPVMAAGTGGLIYIADYVVNGGEIYKTSAGATSPTIITSSTTGLSGTGCVSKATGVAIDAAGELWVSGYGAPDNVCRISNTGSQVLTATPIGTGRTPPPITNADAIAVGLASSAWVLDESHNALYNVKIGSGTAGTISSAVTGGGMTGPVALVVDGNGYVWTSNNNGGPGSVSEFTNTGTALSPSGGFQASSLTQPAGIGIDISGNVWVANYGNTNVLEIIGAAAPTYAPVSQHPATKPGNTQQ